jgi:hypothetical protein
MADLVKFLNVSRMTIESRDGDSIRAKQGSQARTRLLGGWFIQATWLPKRATIAVQPDEGATQVRATIEETLGIGYLDPKLKKKYQRYFEEWMQNLAVTISGVESTQ